MTIPDDDNFKFAISLSVLNHLGRNLYRNFITVLGEAFHKVYKPNLLPPEAKTANHSSVCNNCSRDPIN